MKESRSPSLWVQLYFVLSSLLGLVLTAMGAITFINLVLTKTILKVPEYPRPVPMLTTPEVGKNVEDSTELTEEDRAMIEQWKQDYQRYQQEERDYNYEDAQTKRELAMAIAMMGVGIPILAFHAPWVFRKAA